MSIDTHKTDSFKTNSTEKNMTIIPSLNVSDYKIYDELLGQGGFGKVYKGKCLETGQLVAIKIVNDLQTAANQVRIVSILNGLPNTLKFFGTFFTQKQKPALVFQIFGISLYDFLRHNPTTSQFSTIDIINKITQCVISLKSKGILHGDLKSSNILMNQNHKSQYQLAEVKICDFGLAIQSNNNDRHFNINKGGTITHTPPETIKFGQYTEKSQIWSIGIIMYQLMFKKLPLEKKQYCNEHNLYMKLLSKKIKFPENSTLSKICQRCLHPNQERRIGLEQLSHLLQIQLKKHLTVQNKIYIQNQNDKKLTVKNSQLINNFKLIFQTLEQKILELNCKRNMDKEIIKICHRVNKFESHQQLSQDITKSINVYLLKMKRMLQYSKQQKHVLFNLNQFIILDILLMIIKAMKLSAQGHNPSKQLINYLNSMKYQKKWNYYLNSLKQLEN